MLGAPLEAAWATELSLLALHAAVLLPQSVRLRVPLMLPTL